MISAWAEQVNLLRSLPEDCKRRVCKFLPLFDSVSNLEISAFVADCVDVTSIRSFFCKNKRLLILPIRFIDFALSVTMISDAFKPTPQQKSQEPKETRRSLSGGLSKFRESFRRKRGFQPKRPSFLQDLFKNGYFRSSKKGRFFS